ncbi:MAG: CPBP family intramembrane metalloprotease [Spirochaetaceae bacterium]|nr:CPBP family intramembrane metalloprotease [Spirochaetaceae bacterium]
MQFSAFDELFQIFAFYIPALALVLYFCFRNTPRSLIKQNYFTDNTVFFTARLKFAALVIPCAACLLLIGAFTVIAGTLLEKVEDFPPVFIPVIESPDSFFAVFVMILSCVIAAYFEESFFRVLLYNSLIASGLQKIPAALAASLLFAVCHAWQGFWGVTGAFLSGVFLAFLFEKNKSLHLIALSHALYNITVYLLVFVKAVIFHGSHYSFLIFHY